MWIRHRWTAWVQPKGALLRRIGEGGLVALVAFVIQDQAGNLGAQIGSLLVMTVRFTLLAMTAGAATGCGPRLKPQDRFTLTVEYAARNLAIATVVGAALLGHTEVVVFAAAFFSIQLPLLLAAVMSQRIGLGDLTVS
jgi:predicted Na+-dependent transporter